MYNHIIKYSALKNAVDCAIQSIQILDTQQKKILCECYLQQNTIESTAYKLSVDPMIVRMLYYKLSILLSRIVLTEM